MALQVWLPLNGTLENKGLSNVTVTGQGTVAYDNNGKIGKCFISGGTSQNTNGISLNSNFLSMFNTTKGCSVAAWIKPVGTHVHYNGTIISSGNWNGSCWAFGVSQDNTRVDVFSSGYNRWIDCNIPVNQWTHLACTFQNGTSKVYKNGEYVGELGGFGNFNSDASNTCIGRETYASGYFGFNGRINDVRIYDHVLSPKEVKEISKGLILHYKLDGNDIGITIPRNGGLIPDGVELYDYIQSSGTQWIDTGTKANQYPFKLDIEFMSHTSSGEKDVWGNINSTQGDKYGFVSGVNGQTFFQWGGSVWSKTGATVNQWHVVTYEYPDANNRNMIADGTSYTVAISNNNIILSNSNIYLFSDGPRGSMKFNGKIKYAKIYVGNILKRNMLPCTYLGEPGMWDTVENKFYRNQGTGQFTLGNKITLKEYEYLQNSGTQYINTNFIPNYQTTLEVDYQIIGSGYYWGAGRGEQNNGINAYLGSYVNANKKINFEYQGRSCGYINNVGSTQRTRYKSQIIDNKYYVSNSNEQIIINTINTSKICTGGFIIFGINNGSPQTPTMGGSFKLYNFKLYSNSTLIRDLIPVSYNGTPGLWDKVELKFYANVGTGSFTLGPEKTVQQDAPIFYDSSGYCNHGSITGTLTTNSDSPRYTASTVFNGGNNHIASPSIGKEGFKNSFTVSWWSKTSNMDGKMAWGSSSYGLNLYPSGSYFCWNTGDGVANTIGTVEWATYNDGNWHHYVMTGDGTTGKLYIDGEHKGNAKTYKPLSSPIIYVSGWSTASSYVWDGNISDFRIYCTALSEDDVKELYNTSAFVTNNGVFAEYELYEDNLSDVKKTGLLETADFYENGAKSGYALDTDKTRVASNYIISEDFIEI